MAIHPPGRSRRYQPAGDQHRDARHPRQPASRRRPTSTGVVTRAATSTCVGHGFHDSREAERLLLESADELGLDHHALELDTRHWLETDINAGFGPS